MNKAKTGYSSIDKPWKHFYEGIEQRDPFLNTTPYIGLVENNKEYPKEIAIEYFGSKISFGRLIESVDIVAKALEANGIKKGDFVTICSTTTPEVIYTFYALSKIGAVANVIAPFYSSEELSARINECGSKLIIMADMFVPKFREVFAKELDKKVVILPLMNSSMLRFVTKSVKPQKPNEIGWKSFVKSSFGRKETIVQPYEYSQPMAMGYFSGTTGASKGILLSVDSFQNLINAYGNSGFDTSRNQKVYQNIPPWHSTGLSLGINFPLSYGVRVCTDPRFDQEVFVKNVLKFKPEYILSNTTMYQGFMLEKNIQRLSGKSLSFLKYPVEGGEPLTEKDICNIEDVFKKHGSTARLLNGYGQCECGATVTTDISNHKFSNEASGIPLPKITTIGVFDDEYNEMPYGQRGNILVLTEIGMLEYYKNPEATQEYFHVDSEGQKWSQTGDIGYINEDGSLVVLGRKSDYSIIDGKKLFNFDIERAVLKCRYVSFCEIQIHPEDENQLVAHIVWENDTNKELHHYPEKRDAYLKEIQEKVQDIMNCKEAVPYTFRIWESFPSAYSGKRDIAFIKMQTDKLIRLS